MFNQINEPADYPGFIAWALGNMGLSDLSRLNMEKKAKEFSVFDSAQVKELTEYVVTEYARKLILESSDSKAAYLSLVNFYNRQPISSLRTSNSILLQQYSTPVPIGFLAGLFAGVNEKGNYYEPSAGNGMLTVAGKPEWFTVNEIDDFRVRNLERNSFHEITKRDASLKMPERQKKFDAVITNPPFGALGFKTTFEGYSIQSLDMLMALRALECMKDNGRAAIIIGGHTAWDAIGRIQKGKNLVFFNLLHSLYHVVDTINISGNLNSRQGTSIAVRLILIDGRNPEQLGYAPLKGEHDSEVKTFESLYERVMKAIDRSGGLKARQSNNTLIDNSEFSKVTMSIDHKKRRIRLLELEAEALQLEVQLLKWDGEELGAPYVPASTSCRSLDTIVPDAMSYETEKVLQNLTKAVGGSIDEFVRDRLMYASKKELCQALSAEQSDAVALSIYNFEARNEAVIIGDQTGIGKGRIAAAVIRYAVMAGYRPIFITEKPNLFSDLYRDLVAIGSADLVPLILNSRESKTDIKDEAGNTVYQALPDSEMESILASDELPKAVNFVVATYSQFNSPRKRVSKPSFISRLAVNNIVIMDESHNASGESNTGAFMIDLVGSAKGVLFLSATFAKRPDNLPVYAEKTAIRESNMSREALKEAILKGGVAMQEVLASQLVEHGQMIRRERSSEGIEVNYIELEDNADRDIEIADAMTSILRRIISFQKEYINTLVGDIDRELALKGSTADIAAGTEAVGIDNTPYFSKVFNVINQMLFSIKALSVAKRAVQRLKEGMKPVIAFSSTMGSFIETLETSNGTGVGEGEFVKADFSEVLRRGLNGVFRYTVTTGWGKKQYHSFTQDDLSEQGKAEYRSIIQDIDKLTSGITISPIDVIIDYIEKAGYSVAEVTGRKYELKINPDNNIGKVSARKRLNTNDAFRMFNNNQVDVLMINQSGSTGASAHAIATSMVPASMVKKRVMIILQAELDINIEVQKRGRINRTGQILFPIYDYMISVIPAEHRFMMMLQKKLKSLDANTSSNQKQSVKVLDVPDFLNKFGDKVIAEFLAENKKINLMLGDPLGVLGLQPGQAKPPMDDAAYKVSGRVAVLPVAMQKKFYEDITQRYIDYVDYQKQINNYDLEVETMDLKATTLEKRVIKAGKGGMSSFGDNTLLEKVEANVLRKPFTPEELFKQLQDRSAGKTSEQLKAGLLESYDAFVTKRINREILEEEENYKKVNEDIPNEKRFLKVLRQKGEQAYQDEIRFARIEQETILAENKEKVFKLWGFRRKAIEGLIKFFTMGKVLAFPSGSLEDSETEISMAVSLGLAVNESSESGWMPGQIKVVIAVSNSIRLITIPATGVTELSQIMSASENTTQHLGQSLRAAWIENIRKGNKDRQVRYILTGNVLQSFGDLKRTRLISYTTDSGDTKKGILLPESFEDKQVNRSVIVPLSKIKKILTRAGKGADIFLTDGITISVTGDGYSLLVPANKAKGGVYFLDKELLSLTATKNFKRKGDKMVEHFSSSNLDAVLHLLDTKFNINASISESDYDANSDGFNVKPDAWKPLELWNRPVIVKPDKAKANKVRLLELEALALELELELLNY